MRTSISLAAQAACWALVCSSASAQAPAASASAASAPQAALSKGEIKAMREFKMLDFNGDGKLSRAEVQLFPRLAGAFDEADTDKDGLVSYEEVRVFAARHRAERDRQRAVQAAEAPLPAASGARP